jgi:L-ribulokinase
VEEAQDALCPEHTVIAPDPAAGAAYEALYGLYRGLYFGFGRRGSGLVEIGDVLPELRRIVRGVQRAGV